MSEPLHAPQVAAPGRYHGLETLRAVAISLVFMYHYQVFVSREPTFGWGSAIGWIGVDLFFVLSGYLIANQIFGGLRRGQPLSLKRFYARRLLRTLPNFYVVLALYFLFPVVMGGKEPPPLWRFLTFTQNIQLMPGTAFSHAWSLCIEEQFYLLLPALTLLGLRFAPSLRQAWRLLVALMLATIALRGLLWTHYGLDAGGASRGYYPNIYYASLCRFDEFLPGVAVALLKNGHPLLWQRLLRQGRVLLWAGLVGFVLIAALLHRYYYIDGHGYGFAMTAVGYSLLAVCFAMLVVAALSPNTWLHRLRIPGAATLAAWSYAFYLIHKPVALILKGQLEPLGIAPGSPLAVLLITAACLLAGWLLYRLVETPFMRLRDRVFPSSFRASSPEPVLSQAA